MSRKSAREKRARRQRKSEKWLATRGAREQLGSQAGLARDAHADSGQRPKLSALIWELIGPERAHVVTDEGVRRLVAVAVLGWNLSLSPAAEREAEIASAAQALGGGDPHASAVTNEVLSFLVRRKLAAFPDDERLIAAHDLTRTPDAWHLNVASVRYEPDP